MDLSAALTRAATIDREISLLLDGIELLNTDRRRLAGGAFAIALDIHSSIAVLIERGNYPTAFIASRSLWEAYIRGCWLLKCATDDQLTRFAQDKLNLKTWPMIEALESEGGFEKETLSKLHENNWPRLNAMNHISGPLVVRFNSESGIEANFDDDEILECLTHASNLALLAASGVAEAAVNHDVMMKLWDVQQQFLTKREETDANQTPL